MIPNSHIMVDGQFVSVKHERIVLALKEYSPEIEVKWLPPGRRQDGQAAFAVEHHPPGHPPYVMFYVKNDEDFDERVLARVIMADQRNGKVELSELEAAEEAMKRVQHQEFLDMLEEQHDIAAHILRSPKNTYKVSDDLIIKEGIPFNAARLKDN